MSMKRSITNTCACLECRKSCKKYRFNQLKDGSWEKIDYEVVCPQCGGKVYDAGPAFKSPRQKDLKAWEKLRPLFESGYRFNPGFGSPDEELLVYKASQLPIVQKTEFRKATRKRLRR